MAADRNRDRYRQIILQRSKNPCHQGRLEPHDGRGYAINPLCGDIVEVTLQLTKDRQGIEKICHRSDGCAVCIAATDLMIDVVTGQQLSVIEDAARTFKAMLKGCDPLPSQHPLVALSPLAQLPGRSRCASLGWEALKQAVQGQDNQSSDRNG